MSQYTDKKQGAIVGIIVLLIFCLVAAYAFSQAHADQITLDVPFTPEGQDCIDLSNGNMSKFACIWIAEPKNQTIIENQTIPETAPNATESQITEEEDTNPFAKIIQDNMPLINSIKEKQLRGKSSNLEDETLEAFNNLALCAHGVLESVPIQNYNTYIISPHELPDLKSLDLKKNPKLTNLIAKGLECKYQFEILHPHILGPQYLHLGIEANNDGQMYHSEIAAGLQTYPSQTRANQQSEAVKSLMTGVCYNKLYTEQTRLLMGCAKDYSKFDFSLVGKQPAQNWQFEYYTPMMKLQEYIDTHGNPDLSEYKKKNQDRVNIAKEAAKLGVDPADLAKFLDAQQ